MGLVTGIPFYWCDGPQVAPGGYVLRDSWINSGDPPGTRVVIHPIGAEEEKIARVVDDPIEVDSSVIRAFSPTGLNDCPV